MGGPLRPQTGAGTIVEPQAVPFGLLMGNLSPSRRQIRSTRSLLTCQPACRKHYASPIRGPAKARGHASRLPAPIDRPDGQWTAC